MRLTRTVSAGALVAAVAAILMLATTPATARAAGQSAVSSTHATSHQTSVTDWVTFYGWADNTPPSADIAHPCIHQTAGGVGTYSNPVTFAEPNDLKGPWCQIIYVPFLEKYFIHEDQCDPCGGVNSNHVDLWMGGDKNSTKNPEHKALINCEDQWTRHTTIIKNPPKTEPVDTTALFTPPTTCHGGTGD